MLNRSRIIHLTVVITMMSVTAFFRFLPLTSLKVFSPPCTFVKLYLLQALKYLAVGLSVTFILPMTSNAEQSEYENTTAPEKINIIHSRSSLSVNHNLTSDNHFIELTDFTQAQVGLGDIISVTPGVSLNGQGGLFQSYNIRGFSRSRIKTEVNGVPVITDRRAGNSVAFIPSSLIQSVDVKKGPSSTLYGSGAIGGVVSLSTLNFDDSTVSLLANPQDNTRQLQGHVTNGELSGTLLYRRAQNAHAPDDNNTALFTQHEQKFASISYQFDWRNIDILATTLYSNGEDFGKSSSEFQTSRNTIYPEDKHIISKLQWSQNDLWQFSLYHHQQQWHSDIDNLSTDETTDTLFISRTTLTRYESDTFGSLATYAININDDQSWYTQLFNNAILGAEWIARKNIRITEEEFDSNNAFVFQNDTIDANEDNIGLYLNKTWQPKLFTINAGIRYDWQRVEQKLNNNTISPTSIEDNFLSFSLNTQYQATSYTTLSLAVANAFRFPTVSELFFAGETPRGRTEGNNALVPEESVGGQLDLQHQFNDKLGLKVSSYYYTVDNYIERFTVENNDDDIQLRSFRNIDEVIIKGFEISSHWQINNAISGHLSYQQQQARDENNDTVDDTIPEAIKAQIFWSENNRFIYPIELDTQLEYRLKKTDIGGSEQTLPSDLLWNANLNIQLSDEHKLSFTLFNITNNTYRTSADEDAAFAKERNITIKWQWQFN